MPPSIKSAERKMYLPLLWEVFLQKIDDDWTQKYRHLGSDINSVELGVRLATEVHNDLKAHVVARGGKESTAPTRKTVHQCLEHGGFPTKIKTGHLQILLDYCDYADWADFKKSVADDNPPSDAKKNDNSFRNPLFYFGPVVLLLFTFSFV